MFLQDSRKMAEKLSTFGLQMALNKDVVGPNLKLARERADMRKPQAALDIGITERQLSRWENGEVLPRWGNLLAAAEVYGIDPVELTQDDTNSEKSAPTISQRLQTLDHSVSEMTAKLDAVLELFTDAESLAAALDRRRSAVSASASPPEAADPEPAESAPSRTSAPRAGDPPASRPSPPRDRPNIPAKGGRRKAS